MCLHVFGKYSLQLQENHKGESMQARKSVKSIKYLYLQRKKKHKDMNNEIMESEIIPCMMGLMSTPA